MTQGKAFGVRWVDPFGASGAVDLAARIKAGAVSSREVVAAYIDRIEQINGDLNAVVVPLFEQAMAAAEAADALQAKGCVLGPLHGVPITIKESINIAGAPTTGGLPGRANHRAEADAPLVARLRQAGAIVLGKTNVPQLLLYLETDNPLYGRTNHPERPDRSPGGSSGGEAAIIAAGGSALGIGSDLGGSIRQPAHCCGLHGLKPTSHRLTRQGTLDGELMAGKETIVGQLGPIARRVVDLKTVYQILAAPGDDIRDSSITPETNFTETEDLSSLTIGYYEDDGFFPVAPAIRRVVREAVDALVAGGVRVVPFQPPRVDEAMALYFGLLSSDGAAWTRHWLRAGKTDRRVGDLIKLAKIPQWARSIITGLMKAVGQERLAEVTSCLGKRSLTDYWELVAARRTYLDDFSRAMHAAGCDAIICPPNGQPAYTHGASYFLTATASYTMLYNLLGYPAGVVAAGRVGADEETKLEPGRDLVMRAAHKVELGSAGLPVGVQVVAPPWREDRVLAIMAELEAHFPTGS